MLFLGIFLISMYGVNARGVATPNILIGVLIFFGGVCQFIAGIMEFVSGNTVSLHHTLLTAPADCCLVRSDSLPIIRRFQLSIRHDLSSWLWYCCRVYGFSDG